MAQELRIELIAPNAKVISDLKQTAAAMKDVANAQRQLNGGGSGRAGGGARGPGAINGPNSRLYSLNQRAGIANPLSLAQAQLADLHMARGRAIAQSNRASGINFGSGGFGGGGPARGSLASRFNTFIRSTRFGGNVSPLVGRTMDLFGGGSAAAGAAAGALMGLAAAVKIATERLSELASIGNYAGGSVASASRSARIGAAIGISPGAIGSQAQGVMGSIASGGMAATYAAQYGVRAVGGMGDPSNKIDRFIKLVEGIANDPNEERARRAASALGMEDYLGLRNLSPEVRKRVLEQQKTGPNQGDVTAAADFNAQLGLIGDSFKNIAIKFARPFLDFLGKILEKLSSIIDYVSENWDGGAGASSWLPPEAQKAIKSSGKGSGSVDRNTDAVNENTRALNNMREVFGGGSRARAAIPKAWQGRDFQDRYMKAQARAMGAFAF